MKLALSLLLIIPVVFISCGEQGQKGDSCHVSQKDYGAYVYCDDGSFSYLYHGKPGTNGSNGFNGTSGTCTVESTAIGADINCTDGSFANLINGETGTPGQGCSVEDVVGGVLIDCGASSALIYDGEKGDPGEDGQPGEDAPPTAHQILDIIDPCGDNPGQFDEVVFYTNSGEYVAYFEDGGKRFLTVLTPGSYQTTDAQKCNFKITEDGQLE